MSEKMPLNELHKDGRGRAHASATSLVGLRHDEALARITEFRQGLTLRKSAMALSGFSHEEIPSWKDGYIAGLFDRLAGWLAYSEAAATPPQHAK